MTQTESRSEAASSGAAGGESVAAVAPLSVALPKGRQAREVERLLDEVGWTIRGDERDYRPGCRAAATTVKRLKSQNIPELLAAGRHDIGFSGADWVAETGAEVEQLLDLGTDPVRIIAAAPGEMAEQFANGSPPDREIIIATEYVRLAERWAAGRGIRARIIRTWGATEVFPPEDADLIVDNSATGSTLRAHNLVVVDELMRSSTRLFARPGLLDGDESVCRRLDDLVLMLRASLDARRRVMMEMNVSEENLQKIIDFLPAMRAPTVSSLWGDAGFSVKAAAPADRAAELIPQLRRLGATDIVVYNLEKTCA
jgi:ATP phosphoribosyltransferase